MRESTDTLLWATFGMRALYYYFVGTFAFRHYREGLHNLKIAYNIFALPDLCRAFTLQTAQRDEHVEGIELEQGYSLCMWHDMRPDR